MGYNLKQNDDGSTSLLNEADNTEVLKLDIDGNIDLTAATSVDFAAGAIEIAGVAVTASAAELNSEADVRTEAVTTTNVITAAENGTRFILNAATGFVSTLPAVAAGLEFWFYVGATPPSSGNHTIITNSSANIILGNITSPEDAAGAVSVVQDADTISFVASAALHGDHCHVWCDGTNWYLDGMCVVQDGMTSTQASA